MDKKPQQDEKPFIQISKGGFIGIVIVVILVVAFIVGTHNNSVSSNTVTPGCHNNVAGNEC